MPGNHRNDAGFLSYGSVVHASAGESKIMRKIEFRTVVCVHDLISEMDRFLVAGGQGWPKEMDACETGHPA
jgi:hypothetical protein